jgi:hypothetical protein
VYYDVTDTQPALRVRQPNRVTGCVQAAYDPIYTAERVTVASSVYRSVLRVDSSAVRVKYVLARKKSTHLDLQAQCY